MKTFCMSRKNAYQFYREVNNWKTNEDLPENVAVISIISSPFNKIEGEYHWFEEDKNVLNLDFDDISESENELIAFSVEDARRVIKFVIANKDKDIYINCSAGVSRSQAITRFIVDNFPKRNNETNPDNPVISPNIHVLSTLNRVYRCEYWDLVGEIGHVQEVKLTDFGCILILEDGQEIKYRVADNTFVVGDKIYNTVENLINEWKGLNVS